MPLLPALATRPERGGEGGGGGGGEVNSLFSAAHDLSQEDPLEVLMWYNLSLLEEESRFAG